MPYKMLRIIFILLPISLLLRGCRQFDNPVPEGKPGIFSVASIADGPLKPDANDFAARVAEAAAFCRKQGLENQVAVFVDLGIHSGKNRCFVVRLKDGAIRQQGLVTHGSGTTGLGAGERKYGNKEGSLLSSLGKYKTGAAYTGQFGLAFKLHGLEGSNSNAYKRYIVLHGHECVPDNEMEDLLCQSWGCPTVSPSFLLSLQKVISSTKQPVLLWIYDSSLPAPVNPK